ncbi:MAG: NAD(P)-dependent alcohol dehydrogenase [Paracoccaceae bacterium]
MAWVAVQGAAMKAIIYKKYGPPDVLHVVEVTKPAQKDGALLIKVRAAEVTKADCEMRSFDFPVKWFWLPLRLAIGITAPRRKVLGSYFAGTVEEIGGGVTKFKSGDAIYGATGIGFGAHGEYIRLSEKNTLAIKPDNIGFEAAAAVPMGGMNALHFMRLAKIKPGDKVLVNGAGGSIGIFAVQIAKDMGAEISVVDSGHKRDMFADVGLVRFFDYTKEKFAESGQHYDVVFDMVASSSYADCIKVLAPNGRYITGNPRIGRMIRCAITNRFSDRSATFAFAKETVKELEELRSLIEANRIQVVVDRALPMEEAALAHDLVETEQRLGAIVLAIANE